MHNRGFGAEAPPTSFLTTMIINLTTMIICYVIRVSAPCQLQSPPTCLRLCKHFHYPHAGPPLTLYPPVLTVLNSDTADTTASLTCTSDNTNIPVVFPGNYTALGITTTYEDDTGSTVRLDFELDKDLIELLDGMEFICEARDPDDYNSTVSMSGSTFREVSGI